MIIARALSHRTQAGLRNVQIRRSAQRILGPVPTANVLQEVTAPHRKTDSSEDFLTSLLSFPGARGLKYARWTVETRSFTAAVGSLLFIQVHCGP